MAKTAEGWLKEIDRAKRWQRDKWFKKAEKVVERYRDERDVTQLESNRFNILYANTEVLKGVSYQNTPKPVVGVRYNRSDPVARVTAQVLERALEYSIDEYDFDGLMEAVVEDYWLPGRAVAQVAYKPTFADVDGVEQVVYEQVQCDYVEWEFFLHQPAKQWKNVNWVGFGKLLTRADAVKQFGKAVGNEIELTWRPKDANEEDQEAKRALVWKIWDKITKQVLVVSDGYKRGFLAKLDDPLNLEDFYPIPKPLLAISTTNSLLPIPDYCQYQDQARELDDLTARITAIVDALRRRGLYDGSIEELQQLADCGDNVFIPVQNYAALREKGGLKGVFDVEDFKPYSDVLVNLFEQREQVKRTIYEVTGISDIVRGVSAPSETLGAQRIKAQYSNIRITPRQKQINRFARDLFRLKAEVIAEQFSPQTLAMMTGIELPQTEQEAQAIVQQAQQQGAPMPENAGVSWEAVINLMRNDHLRGFRIDIETDVTIAPDEQAEKESVTEMVTAFGQMIAQIGPAVGEGYMPIEVAKQILMFAMRKFHASRDIEEALEKIGDEMPPSKGENDAKEQAAAAQAQVEQGRLQLEQQKAQFDQQYQAAESKFEAQKAQMEQQMEQQKMLAEATIERETAQIKAQTEIQVANIKAANDYQIAEMKAQIDAAAKIMIAQEKNEATLAAQANDREAEPEQESEQTGALAVAIEGIKAVMERLSAPKQVVRGKNGEVTGIRPMMNGGDDANT